MTQINLLPWREQARYTKKVRFGIAVLCAIAFGVIVTLGRHGHYDRLIEGQEGRNNFLQTVLGAEQVEVTALNKQKKEKMQIEEDLNFIFSLRNANYQAVHLLDALVHVVPDAVIFRKVTREGNQISVIGQAISNMQVTELIKNMKLNPIFLQPRLSDITGKENTSGEERTFELKFEQAGSDAIR